MRLRSQSTPCPPCSHLSTTETAVYWMVQRALRKGFPRLFPLSCCQCLGAAAVRKGQSCPMLGTAGSSQRYSVKSEGKRERNNAADTKVREGEGRRYQSTHSPAACGRDHGGEGKKHDEEGKAKCCALSRTPIPHCLVLLRGHVKEPRVKLTLGRRGGRGERSFWVCFCFSPSYTVINW